MKALLVLVLGSLCGAAMAGEAKDAEQIPVEQYSYSQPQPNPNYQTYNQQAQKGYQIDKSQVAENCLYSCCVSVAASIGATLCCNCLCNMIS